MNTFETIEAFVLHDLHVYFYAKMLGDVFYLTFLYEGAVVCHQIPTFFAIISPSFHSFRYVPMCVQKKLSKVIL